MASATPPKQHTFSPSLHNNKHYYKFRNLVSHFICCACFSRCHWDSFCYPNFFSVWWPILPLVATQQQTASTTATTMQHHQHPQVPTTTKAERKQYNRACSQCQKHHRACSKTIPCDRCIKAGEQDLCTLVPSKRKPKNGTLCICCNIFCVRRCASTHSQTHQGSRANHFPVQTRCETHSYKADIRRNVTSAHVLVGSKQSSARFVNPMVAEQGQRCIYHPFIMYLCSYLRNCKK